MPSPCLTVGDIIESLKTLHPDTPIALTEVSHEFMPLRSPSSVTTLTLKAYGDLRLPSQGRQASIEGEQMLLPVEPLRLE